MSWRSSPETQRQDLQGCEIAPRVVKRITQSSSGSVQEDVANNTAIIFVERFEQNVHRDANVNRRPHSLLDAP
jgi:hypothetical protein